MHSSAHFLIHYEVSNISFYKTKGHSEVNENNGMQHGIKQRHSGTNIVNVFYMNSLWIRFPNKSGIISNIRPAVIHKSVYNNTWMFREGCLFLS